jgi:hypothetical protein
MNGWGQDLRFALRQLRKSSGFSLIAVLTIVLWCRRQHGDFQRGQCGFVAASAL